MEKDHQQEPFYTFKWENICIDDKRSEQVHDSPQIKQNTQRTRIQIKNQSEDLKKVYLNTTQKTPLGKQKYIERKSSQNQESDSKQFDNFNGKQRRQFIDNKQQSGKRYQHLRSNVMRRTRKYQISTNNAHKKYINCLKNLFYEVLSQPKIKQFEQEYLKRRSNRVFFFIILVYIKYRFNPQLGLAIKQKFILLMNDKIQEYEEQILKCNDFMLKNYRHEEIHEIEIALKAIEEFYSGNTDRAVECLYRKDKHIIVKQNHFRASLKLVQDMQKQYELINEPEISEPTVKYNHNSTINSKLQQRSTQKYQNIDLKQLINIQIQSNNQYLVEHLPIPQIPLQKASLSYQENSIKNKEKNSHEQQMDSIQEQISQSQSPNNSDQQSLSSPERSNHNFENQIPLPKNSNLQSLNIYQKSPISDIIFPPIPPYFYLPKFDQNYGSLLRRLVYVKSWRQMNQGFQQQYNEGRSKEKNNKKQFIPSPLVFGAESSL